MKMGPNLVIFFVGIMLGPELPGLDVLDKLYESVGQVDWGDDINLEYSRCCEQNKFHSNF
jgi:hypothetical protein